MLLAPAHDMRHLILGYLFYVDVKYINRAVVEYFRPRPADHVDPPITIGEFVWPVATAVSIGLVWWLARRMGYLSPSRIARLRALVAIRRRHPAAARLFPIPAPRTSPAQPRRRP